MSTSINIPDDKTQLSQFLEQFIGRLASDNFSDDGSLLSYLAKPESQRSSDEVPVVDYLISQPLLLALGFETKSHKYNEHKDNKRPDFAPRIPEYPDRACFIVEDKKTTEATLPKHRGQLQSYMGQHRAPQGFLCNGHAILVYDQTEILQTPVLEISLTEAVRLWRGESLFTDKKGIEALIEMDIISIFAAFWRRFCKESFAGSSRLIDELTLQSDAGNNKPHKTDGTTWKSNLCRIAITPVTEENAPMLTNSLKQVISEIEDDARAQFVVIERDYQKYLGLLSKLPNDTIAITDRENNYVADVVGLLNGDNSDLKDAVADLILGIVRSEVDIKQLSTLKKRIYAAQKVNPKHKGTPKDPIHNLCLRIESFTKERQRYLKELRIKYRDTIRVMGWYESWKQQTSALVFQSEDAIKLRREFLTQTSYLIVIRILLVRIMEDKKIIKRMFTNGGIALWFHEVEPHYLSLAIGRSTGFLLDMAYTSAQHIYAHFYTEKTVFDWYQPDRNAIIRVLHILAGFDLSNINRDIIGTVYNQYVEAKHKHESGLYYTPAKIVSYMLDRIGYKGTDILGKNLIDLSCGSGGFLVEAAHRLVKAYHQYYQEAGFPNIPADKIQGVLDQIRGSLYGIDLNPFACALAETNLLIQVIDLFAIALKGDEQATIDRFHIYNADSLRFSSATLSYLNHSLSYSPEDLPVADKIRAGIWEWKDKFDFAVGNPPYVSAAEGAVGLVEYRKSVKTEHPIKSVQKTLMKKWDLFVPFVASSHAALKEKTDYHEAGRAAIITSNGIETLPYSEGLRLNLAKDACIDEVHFFEGVKLFEDANVINTITVFTNSAPATQHYTKRFWHNEIPEWGSHGKTRKQSLRQSSYRGDVFRRLLPHVQLKAGITSIALPDIFYISVGMVLNANEKKNKGAFKMEDLISDTYTVNQSVPFTGSKDIDRFGISNVRYLEYGNNTRVPSQVRRPTFPELYDRPKMMVAEFGGFAYDDGAWDSAGYLKCNHSVFILMAWNQLAGVSNNAIENELGDRIAARDQLEQLASQLDPWYILAYLNSRQMREMLTGVARTAIEFRLQPDDLRQIKIPLIDDKSLISKLANLAQDAAIIQKHLLLLRKKGWTITKNRITAPIELPADMPTLPFGTACVSWGITIKDKNARANNLVREQLRLFSGKKEAMIFPASATEDAAEWIVRQLSNLDEGVTISQVERNGLLLPAKSDLAVKSLLSIKQSEATVTDKCKRIADIQEEISNELMNIFEEIQHPPIH